MTTIGEMDVHLINEGRHEQLWDVLGAHVGPDGTTFRVWAPAALEVQVRGDFNSWDGSRNPLTQVATSGIWETTVPGIGSGEGYKFHIRGADGEWHDKADPMAFWTEVPPATASRVFAEHPHVDRRRVDGRAQQRTAPTSSRCRSTRCTSGPGASTRAPVPTATTSWPSTSRRTSWRWASRTSSCSR